MSSHEGETRGASLQQYEHVEWLVDRLREGVCPGLDGIAAHMERDKRTAMRLITFMRDRLGAPIVYNRSRRGYDLTEPTWFLPRVGLTEGELFSLMVARRAMAQYRGTPMEKTLERIFRKIAGDLGEQIQVNPDLMGGSLFRFAPMPVLEVDEAVWNVLLEAARQRRTARIRYRSLRSDRERERRIDPYQVVNLTGDWYVFAWDHRREKVCQFQIHRISRAWKTECAFDIDPGFDPDALVRGGFGAFGSGERMREMRLRIYGDAAKRLAGRQFHHDQTVAPTDDGFELRFPVSAAGDRPYLHVIQWILGQGHEVEVLAPSELRRALKEEIERMRRVYEKT